MRIVAVVALALVALTCVAEAKDVTVRGYTTRNGTYVAPHVRSAPNGKRSDNYGPKVGGTSPAAPYSVYGQRLQSRDADRDGLPNYRDHDDNNNSLTDDRDPHQYRQREDPRAR